MTTRPSLLPSGHTDGFARASLPDGAHWPSLDLEPAGLRYPDRLNAAVALLASRLAPGEGQRIAFRVERGNDWTYAQLAEQVERIAAVLVEDLGLEPGNRLLLHGFNTPMTAACWLAAVRAGAVLVTTMPLLRRSELDTICARAAIRHALVDAALGDAVPDGLARVLTYGTGELEQAMKAAGPPPAPADTAQDDVCLIAFTSGTTGAPKGTMHFHRDVLAISDLAPRALFDLGRDDVVTGMSPFGFTFGLGALLLFPVRHGAASALVARASPESLLDAVEQRGATVLFTTPTAYRMLLERLAGRDLSSLRLCIASGEHLPPDLFERWRDATGLAPLEVLGSTEMLHCFIGARPEEARPGVLGRTVPGYEATLLDEAGARARAGEPGRLAVRGPTGCRYLDDPRQREQVVEGWTLTGDLCALDADGRIHYRGRHDDLIVSGGYNICAPEVEDALLRHPAVSECVVVGVPDARRGAIVKAFVVARERPDEGLARALQDHVKQAIAPYKYPRAVEFVPALPRTESGKVARGALRTGAR